MTILALSTDEAPRSAAGHWGILAGLFVIYLVWRIDLEIRKRRGEVGDHSPTELAAPAPVDTPRSRPSRLTSHGETSQPRIERIGQGAYVSYEPSSPARRVYATDSDGRRQRVVKAPPAYGDESFGDELDVALEIVADEPVDDDEFDDEPVETARETPEEYVRRCVDAGVKKAAIVAALHEHYGTKRATAYRLVDRVAPGAKPA